MSNGRLTIGFVRRGYSPSGGAESYLKRLALGVVGLGHEAHLFATNDWPPNEWPFGQITQINAGSTIAFADEVEKRRAKVPCDVLMSLERIWRCDVFRAGDGVHQVWLNRRKKFEAPWKRFIRRFNRKHSELLRLEKSLLDDRGAERVIANSQMVKSEIVDLYNYRRDKIDVVRNGVPFDLRGGRHFHFADNLRSVFQCMPGGARLRPACDHDAGKWVFRDHGRQNS